MTTPRVTTTRERHAAAWQSLFEEFMKPLAERSELRARALMSGLHLRAWQRESLAALLGEAKTCAELWYGTHFVYFGLPEVTGVMEVTGRTPRLALLNASEEVGRA